MRKTTPKRELRGTTRPLKCQRKGKRKRPRNPPAETIGEWLRQRRHAELCAKLRLGRRTLKRNPRGRNVAIGCMPLHAVSTVELPDGRMRRISRTRWVACIPDYILDAGLA